MADTIWDLRIAGRGTATILRAVANSVDAIENDGDRDDVVERIRKIADTFEGPRP